MSFAKLYLKENLLKLDSFWFVIPAKAGIHRLSTSLVVQLYTSKIQYLANRTVHLSSRNVFSKSV